MPRGSAQNPQNLPWDPHPEREAYTTYQSPDIRWYDSVNQKYKIGDVLGAKALWDDAKRYGINLKDAAVATPGVVSKGLSAAKTFLADNAVTQGALGFAATHGPIAALGAAAGAGLGGYLLYKGAKKLFGSTPGYKKDPYKRSVTDLYPSADYTNQVTKNLSKYQLPNYGYPPTSTNQYLYPVGLPTAPPNRWNAYPQYYNGYPYVRTPKDNINENWKPFQTISPPK